MDYQVDEANRRPLKSRQWAFAERLTTVLANAGVTPNAISVAGMTAALIGGVCFSLTSSVQGLPVRLLWLAGAVCVQLRLLANLLDGMVAVKSQKASPIGEVFNEVPDRVSDAAIFIGLGFAILSDPLAGALLAGAAIATAYVRAFGASVGLGQDFRGPFGKPQRMFVVTLLGLWGAIAPSTSVAVPAWTLWGLLAGTLLTVVRRIHRMTQGLKQRHTHGD